MYAIVLSRSAEIAKQLTINAASAKDWRLRNRRDREFKRIARDLASGKGYVIATNYQLAKQYPGMLDVRYTPESKPMVWAVNFSKFGRSKMSFMPIR